MEDSFDILSSCHDDILIEIASKLGRDLNAMFLDSKRLSTLAYNPQLAARWISKRAEPLSRREVRHIFSRKTLEFHLDVVRLLLSQQEAPERQACGVNQQDWDVWALMACQLGHGDVADLLYSTPAWEDYPRPSVDHGKRGSPLKVGDVTDLMLQLSLPSRTTSAADAVGPSRAPPWRQQEQLYRPVQKRPLISRYSHSPTDRADIARMYAPLTINRLSAMSTSHCSSAAGAGPPLPCSQSISSATDARRPIEAPGSPPCLGNPSSMGMVRGDSSSSVIASQQLLHQAAASCDITDGSVSIGPKESWRLRNFQSKRCGQPSISGPRLADVGFCNDAALRHACHIGDVAMVRMLVGHGADIQARDGMPLALAAAGGHVDVSRFLIEEAGRFSLTCTGEPTLQPVGSP